VACWSAVCAYNCRISFHVSSVTVMIFPTICFISEIDGISPFFITSYFPAFSWSACCRCYCFFPFSFSSFSLLFNFVFVFWVYVSAVKRRLFVFRCVLCLCWFRLGFVCHPLVFTILHICFCLLILFRL
jgi:hypothetical protein